MATVNGPMTICTKRKSNTRQVHKYLSSEQVDKRQDLDVVVPVVDRLAHLLGNVFLHKLTQYRHIVVTLAIHCLMNDLWHFQLFGFPCFNNHISVVQTLYFFFTPMDTFIQFSLRGTYHQEG